MQNVADDGDGRNTVA